MSGAGKTRIELDTRFGGNLLLKSLRSRDRALLAPHLDVSMCRRGDVLFHMGEPVSLISFPCDGVIATLSVAMRDGRVAETATIGREGAIGGVVSQGLLPAFSQAVVQIGGPVLRMDAVRLQEVKTRSEAVRNLFIRYADCLLAQVLQSVACNALHTIEERCARWLLTVQDRLGTETLPVTHELLADMLGVQRSYLTRVLRTLQQQDLIATGRGRITIVDRDKLERAACECHGAVGGHFKRVLGALYSRSGAFVALAAADPAAEGAVADGAPVDAAAGSVTRHRRPPSTARVPGPP